MKAKGALILHHHYTPTVNKGVMLQQLHKVCQSAAVFFVVTVVLHTPKKFLMVSLTSFVIVVLHYSYRSANVFFRFR